MKKVTLIMVFLLVFVLAGCALTDQPSSSNTNVGVNINANTNVNGNVNVSQQPVVNNKNKLDLSNQGLKELPKYVLTMTNLEELNLSGNNLTGALPAEVRQLKNLKILDMSNNQMTGIPAEVGQLSNLLVLNLANNQFTGLPNELANLKKLQTLNLSGNAYSQQDLDVITQGLSKTVNIIK